MKLIVACLILPLISCVPAYGGAQTAGEGYMPTQRVQYGVASWYGEREQGRLMACGEPFNKNAMVAAHRTLPLGTAVRVTNLRNGRSVVVRIMDRGPHVAGRAIDLSMAAAERLQFIRRGVAPVKICVLNLPNKRRREADHAPHASYNDHDTALWANTSERANCRPFASLRVTAKG